MSQHSDPSRTESGGDLRDCSYQSSSEKMGYNAAKELYTRVQNSLAKRREEDEDDE